MASADAGRIVANVTKYRTCAAPQSLPSLFVPATWPGRTFRLESAREMAMNQIQENHGVV